MSRLKRTMHIFFAMALMVGLGYLWSEFPPAVDAPHDQFMVCAFVTLAGACRAVYSIYEALEPERIEGE